MESGDGLPRSTQKLSLPASIGRALSFLAFLLAAVVVVWTVGDQWQNVIQQIEGIHLWPALVSVAAGLVMACLSGPSLAVLAMPGRLSLAQLWSVARVYLVAQILKYLPGRIWALIYQVGKIRESVGTRMAVAASLSQMFLSVFGSVVLFGAATNPGPILWPFAIAAGCAWVWRGGVTRYLGIDSNNWASFRHVLKVFGLATLEWITFATVAWMICYSIDAANNFNLTLVAFYAISWIVGGLSMLTPGGLVIREGGFIFLCQLGGIQADFAAAFALIARMSFTASELLAAAAAWLVRGQDAPTS